MISRRRTYQEIRRSFGALFSKLCRSREGAVAWQDMVYLVACSISNAVDKAHYEQREKAWQDTISKYSRVEQGIFPLLYQELVSGMDRDSSKDFLGDVYCELGLNTLSNGKFFSPIEAARVQALLSADSVLNTVVEQGYAAVNDSACGSGAGLIAMADSVSWRLKEKELNWQNHVLFIGQDINLTAALMCYIQLSLLGAAGYVKVGNVFSDPVMEGDDLSSYWFTPMYYSEIWAGRPAYKGGFLP